MRTSENLRHDLTGLPGTASDLLPAEPAGRRDMHEDTFERLRRQAEHRLDVLIGRRGGDMAFDLHWPTSQLADAIGFMETGFAFFGREPKTANGPDGAPPASDTEAAFFLREIPVALKDAREAVTALRKLSSSMTVLAREACGTAHIWSPAELMQRAAGLSQPLWRRHYILDLVQIGQENARLTSPARAILTALVDVIVQATREPTRPGERIPLVLGLYRDGTNMLHYRLDLPAAMGPQLALAGRTRLAERMVRELGGMLSVSPNAEGSSIRMDLPEP